MSAQDIYVTFRWDGADWAFAIDDVTEVASARAVTPVPGTSAFLLGIAAWRGRTLPVFLPRALKTGAPPPDLNRRLLVLRHPAPFAVPVDEPGRVIRGVTEVPDSAETRPDPAVQGLLRVEGSTVRVLDPRRLVEREGATGGDAGAGEESA